MPETRVCVHVCNTHAARGRVISQAYVDPRRSSRLLFSLTFTVRFILKIKNIQHFKFYIFISKRAHRHRKKNIKRFLLSWFSNSVATCRFFSSCFFSFFSFNFFAARRRTYSLCNTQLVCTVRYRYLHAAREQQRHTATRQQRTHIQIRDSTFMHL